MKASNFRFIAQSDDAFMPLLKKMYDPPISLYWKGEYNVDRPCIFIVGTRRATLYGHSIARKFAYALSQLGFCIVAVWHVVLIRQRTKARLKQTVKLLRCKAAD